MYFFLMGYVVKIISCLIFLFGVGRCIIVDSIVYLFFIFLGNDQFGNDFCLVVEMLGYWGVKGKIGVFQGIGRGSLGFQCYGSLKFLQSVQRKYRIQIRLIVRVGIYGFCFLSSQIVFCQFFSFLQKFYIFLFLILMVWIRFIRFQVSFISIFYNIGLVRISLVVISEDISLLRVFLF